MSVLIKLVPIGLRNLLATSLVMFVALAFFGGGEAEADSDDGPAEIFDFDPSLFLLDFFFSRVFFFYLTPDGLFDLDLDFLLL